MDPNLEKIKDAHTKHIRRGRLGIPIQQAKDYLRYIHGYNEKQVDTELDEFVTTLRLQVKQWRARNGKLSQEENVQHQ